MKVLNLNIWNQNYYWEHRLPIIIKMLQEEDFGTNKDDVLFFNEVSNTKNHIQLAEINRHLKYKNSLFFEVNRDVKKGIVNGMGLLTNIDIVRQQVIPLSQDLSDPDDSFPRICVLLHMKSPRGNFVFVGVHFAIGFEAQIRNAKETLANIEGFNRDQFPVIVCGDFNCGYQEFPANIFREEGFTDVWQELSQPESATWPVERDLIINNHRLKYNTDLPWQIEPRRMDFVWTKKVSAKQIKKISLKMNNVWHSDHYGVVADF